MFHSSFPRQNSRTTPAAVRKGRDAMQRPLLLGSQPTLLSNSGHPVISRQPNFFILALFLRQSPLETLCNFFPLTHVAFSPARSRDFPRTFLTFILCHGGERRAKVPLRKMAHISPISRGCNRLEGSDGEAWTLFACWNICTMSC